MTDLFFFGTNEVIVRLSLNANNDDSISRELDFKNDWGISILLALKQNEK